MDAGDEVVSWLLASDPAVAWQTSRDLLDAPEDVWAEQRRRVETAGWGAELLTHRDADGQWAGAADVVRALRQPDLRWLVERTLRGRSWLAMDAGVGQPSPWITLKALRVLRWLDA